MVRGLVHRAIYVIAEWHEQGVVCSELCVVEGMEPTKSHHHLDIRIVETLVDGL